jgi:hypothetical protein
MNQANVDALNALIGVWERDEIDTKYGGYPSLAEWLASHGVLAVDALTHEAAHWPELVRPFGEPATVVLCSCGWTGTQGDWWPHVRAALARIAKGETP